MKNKNDEISEGLNQIFEIINAKGDEGELREIVKYNQEEQLSEIQSQKQ